MIAKQLTRFFSSLTNPDDVFLVAPFMQEGVIRGTAFFFFEAVPEYFLESRLCAIANSSIFDVTSPYPIIVV